MKKTTYIIIGIILILVILFLTRKTEYQQNQDDFFISTSSQSNNRIKKLELNKSSEDASHILDESKLQIPKIEKKEKRTEYKADPKREWIINLKTPNKTIVKKEKLDELFNLEWRTNFSSTIFGHSTKNNKWTYAISGNTPDTYDQIQVAINLLDLFNEENPNYDRKRLERYLIELKKRLNNHSINFEIEENETIESAIEKSKQLVKSDKTFNKHIIIGLQSENKYNGKEVWDVLLSLGLKWGDGDLFHWDNNTGYAFDEHFKVWTSTEPGYFLPEEIKKGKMNPTDLVFGFSIEGSADPLNVYKILINSIKYCQTRLGGEIINRNREPFNEQLEFIELTALIKKMNDNGIIPGSDN